MRSSYETFFDNERIAVVGHDKRRPFPRLSLAGLRKRGKQVTVVDPEAREIEGLTARRDLEGLEGQLDAVLIEVPKEESAVWVERAADVGVRHVWLHMGTDTPAARAVAERRGLDLRTGSCAVMYLDRSFPHSVHRWINQLVLRY